MSSAPVAPSAVIDRPCPCLFVRVTFWCQHHAYVSCCGKTDEPNLQWLLIDPLDSVHTTLRGCSHLPQTADGKAMPPRELVLNEPCAACLKTSMSDAQKAQEKDKLFARNSTLADLEPVTSPEAAKLRASCWDNWVREMRSLAEDTALAWELYWEMVFKSIGHKLRVLEEAETEA